jgi:hypothetical protein
MGLPLPGADYLPREMKDRAISARPMKPVRLLELHGQPQRREADGDAQPDDAGPQVPIGRRRRLHVAGQGLDHFRRKLGALFDGSPQGFLQLLALLALQVARHDHDGRNHGHERQGD